MSISYPIDRSTYAQSGSVIAQRVTSSEENPVTVGFRQQELDIARYNSVGQLTTISAGREGDRGFIDFFLGTVSNGYLNTKNTFYTKTQLTDIGTSGDAYGTLMTVGLRPLLQADFNYNINAEVFNTASVTGSVSTLSGNMIVECSGGAGSYSQLESKHHCRIRPGQGAGTRFSAYFTPNASGTQIYGWGSSTDGYFVGMTGSNFGILHRSHGIETWVTQSDFNIDPIDGGVSSSSGFNINPGNGNVFDIQAQWLGYGAITFNVVNPETGRFMPFHQIQYANANSVPSTRFNSEKILVRVDAANGNTNPITISGASLLTYVEGESVYSGPRFAIANSKTSITTETNILTIQNKSTFHSLTNKVAVKLKSLAYAVEGTKPAIVKIYRNATLGNTPSYTDIDLQDSVVSYDTAGTTVSGGSLIVSYAVGKSSSDVVYGDDLDLWVYPGDTLTISAQSTANTDVSVSVSWIEDH